MQHRPCELEVAAVEAVGAYTLLRLRTGGADTGGPGQFFMLTAEPRPAQAYLGRPLSPAWVENGEIAFILDIRGAGLRALKSAARVRMLGPLGRGFELKDTPAVLVGGGIGAAVLPWLRRELEGRVEVTTVLGFRTEAHAVCAGLVDPAAQVVLEPAFVTEPLADALRPGVTVYACGPDPMLHAVAGMCAERGIDCHLAMEAPMACGFGACYGCAVRIDGELKRLCVEGPVLEASRVLA